MKRCFIHQITRHWNQLIRMAKMKKTSNSGKKYLQHTCNQQRVHIQNKQGTLLKIWKCQATQWKITNKRLKRPYIIEMQMKTTRYHNEIVWYRHKAGIYTHGTKLRVQKLILTFMDNGFWQGCQSNSMGKESWLWQIVLWQLGYPHAERWI